MNSSSPRRRSLRVPKINCSAKGRRSFRWNNFAFYLGAVAHKKKQQQPSDNILLRVLQRSSHADGVMDEESDPQRKGALPRLKAATKVVVKGLRVFRTGTSRELAYIKASSSSSTPGENSSDLEQ